MSAKVTALETTLFYTAAVRKNALRHNAVRHDAVSHNAERHKEVRHKHFRPNAVSHIVHHNAIRNNALRHNAVYLNAVRQNSVLNNAVRHDGKRHKTVLLNNESHKPVNLYGNVYLKGYAGAYFFPDNLILPYQYLDRAMSLAQDDELRARIAFALAKTEQLEFYVKNDMLGYYWFSDEAPEGDGILISNRKYFRELSKYSNTRFYNEVKTNCLYFDYYVTH
jgi:hypothetical protein